MIPLVKSIHCHKQMIYIKNYTSEFEIKINICLYYYSLGLYKKTGVIISLSVHGMVH